MAKGEPGVSVFRRGGGSGGVEERVGGVSHRAQEERASEASGGVEELYEVVSGMNILMTVMGEWER